MVLFHGSILEPKNGVLSFSSTDDDVLVMFHGHAPTPQSSKFWCKPVNDAGLPKRSASADTRIGYQKTQSQLQMKRQQNQIKSMDFVFVCRFCLARVGLEVQSMDCMYAGFVWPELDLKSRVWTVCMQVLSGPNWT